MSFPKDFLIGASTAAHQVEGNNIHSDYWAQEQMPHDCILCLAVIKHGQVKNFLVR